MTAQPKLRFRKLRADAMEPRYATNGAAGFDLSAALDSPIVVAPGERCLVPTGLAMAIPLGFEGQVRPRSGLAARHGLTVLNTPGTIDSDYRGEIKVILVNLGHEPYTIQHGERIAQMVLAAHATAEFEAVESLDETARGDGGFGSTGRH